MVSKATRGLFCMDIKYVSLSSNSLFWEKRKRKQHHQVRFMQGAEITFTAKVICLQRCGGSNAGSTQDPSQSLCVETCSSLPQPLHLTQTLHMPGLTAVSYLTLHYGYSVQKLWDEHVLLSNLSSQSFSLEGRNVIITIINNYLLLDRFCLRCYDFWIFLSYLKITFASRKNRHGKYVNSLHCAIYVYLQSKKMHWSLHRTQVEPSV